MAHAVSWPWPWGELPVYTTTSTPSPAAVGVDRTRLNSLPATGPAVTST